MAKKSWKYYVARAKVAKAMSHASRLMMLELLRSEDMCVNDLTAVVGVNQSTVSKHLTVLKEAGLVTIQKKGAKNFYRLAKKASVSRILDSLNSVLESNLKESRAAMR